MNYPLFCLIGLLALLLVADGACTSPPAIYPATGYVLEIREDGPDDTLLLLTESLERGAPSRWLIVPPNYLPFAKTALSQRARVKATFQSTFRVPFSAWPLLSLEPLELP